MCCYASSSISFTQSLGRVATTSTSQTTFNAVNTGEQTSLAEPNPFSRHQRHTFTSDKVCHVWNSHSAEALCGKGRWARLRLMREILLFSRDCDEPSANIYLGELFRLDWRVIRTETDLIALTEQLRPGVEGRDCVLSPLHSPKCHTCFERIDTAMTQLNAAYMAFEHTLRRFDCLLAVDSSSATRPFSPNGTCLDCKIWYRKWLLVELVRVWQQPPCINWCFYTQLACPHFGTSKVVDFAGHPAFMCRDLNIPQISTGSSSNGDYIPDEDGIRTCNCVHPCDLQRDFQSSADMQQYFATALERQAEKEAANHPYDFYASVEHCWARRKRCRAQLVQPLVDGVSPSTSDRFNGANALVVPTTRVKKNGNAIN